MALEIANFISGLDKSWPTGLDPFNKGDDHLRLTKSVLKNTFPGVDGDGFKEAILATEEDLNNCTNTTGNLQEQIDANSDALTDSAFVPIGGIINFNASFASIPSNFQLCDGTNGTPNLVNKFIYGTNTEGQLLDSGGFADAVNISHTHTENQAGLHSHTPEGGGLFLTTVGGSTADDGSIRGTASKTTDNGLHSHTINAAGVSGVGRNIPPYIKLAYIQRMS